MNVFSNPSSPTVEYDMINKLNIMNENINNNNKKTSSSDTSGTLQGTTTSSTFSNVMSFDSSYNNLNINNNNNNNNLTSTTTTVFSDPSFSPRQVIEELENEKERTEEEEDAEGTRYNTCSVCRSISSTSSKSSSIGRLSKSSTGGSLHLDITNDGHPPHDQPTSPNVVEEVIANLESLAANSGKASNSKEAGGPRSYLMREESKVRIERVLAALSAGTIHEVSWNEKEREEEKVEEKKEEENAKVEEEVEGEEEEEEEILLPRIESLNEPLGVIEEEGEEETNVEGEKEEEKEVDKVRKRLLDQQHSDHAIQRPQLSHFASEFPRLNMKNEKEEGIEGATNAVYMDKDEK